MKGIRLSILDQSVVRQNASAADAIAETIETARLAEQLNYHRIWVSEHHNSSFIAGSAPEILMARLANETHRIRIGSGGIMLPNHSAYKVAENFRMLETLYPGRIDLGMGRAPGGDRIAASLLNPSNTFAEEEYLTQLEHLQHFFRDTAGTKYGPVIAAPQAATIPAQWILSSSGGSSAIAAKFGMGLVIARFINGFAGKEIVDIYRKAFVPSSTLLQPQAMLAISVLCADTEEKAAAMRKNVDYILLQFDKGNYDKFPEHETIQAYRFSATEQARINYNGGRTISGTLEKVKAELSKLAGIFDVDEIIVSTMTATSADRRHSFELLAKAFDL